MKLIFNLKSGSFHSPSPMNHSRKFSTQIYGWEQNVVLVQDGGAGGGGCWLVAAGLGSVGDQD